MQEQNLSFYNLGIAYGSLNMREDARESVERAKRMYSASGNSQGVELSDKVLSKLPL